MAPARALRNAARLALACSAEAAFAAATLAGLMPLLLLATEPTDMASSNSRNSSRRLLCVFRGSTGRCLGFGVAADVVVDALDVVAPVVLAVDDTHAAVGATPLPGSLGRRRSAEGGEVVGDRDSTDGGDVVGAIEPGLRALERGKLRVALMLLTTLRMREVFCPASEDGGHAVAGDGSRARTAVGGGLRVAGGVWAAACCAAHCLRSTPFCCTKSAYIIVVQSSSSAPERSDFLAAFLR